MTQCITQTLRACLFEHPRPVLREELFAELELEMFPGREFFLKFLDARRTETQLDAARTVLLRLAYASHVFPPNKLLFNLLKTECTLAGDTSSGPHVFQGRDHFAHLVHLYLLGLYVFWYHKDLQTKICRQFRLLHPLDDPHSPEKPADRDRRAIFDFIGAWRSFVLFHDLGYPWEAGDALKGKGEQFLLPFGDLARYMAKDCALYTLSQLLAFQWLRKYKETQTLEEDLPKRAADFLKVANPSFPEDLFVIPEPQRTRDSLLLEAEQLSLPRDPDLLKFVRLFVPAENIVGLLAHNTTGEFAGASHADVQSALEHASPDTESGNGVAFFARHAATGTLPGALAKDHHWTYYIIDLDSHFHTFAGMLFRKGQQTLEFDAFCTQFFDEIAGMGAHEHDERFADFGFAIYKHLMEMLDFDAVDTVSRSALMRDDYIINQGLNDLDGVFQEYVIETIRKQLAASALALRVKNESLTTVEILPYLEKVLCPLEDTGSIAASLEAELSAKLRNRIGVKRALYAHYNILKDRVHEFLQVDTPWIKHQKEKAEELLSWLKSDEAEHPARTKAKRKTPDQLRLMEEYEKKKKEYQEALRSTGIFAPAGLPEEIFSAPSWDTLQDHQLADKIDRLLKDRGLGGIRELSEYTLPFAKPSGAAGARHACASDHGLASGLLYIATHSMCSALDGEAKKGQSMFSLLRLRGVSTRWLQGHESGNQADCAEVGYTILAHNLYPKSLKEAYRGFRTSNRYSQAFSFLSMLCDSLQTWDRKRLFNQGTGMLSYSIYSEDFNIEVARKTFRVTERGPGPTVATRQWRLREHLDQFLEGASSMIELSLSEFLPTRGQDAAPP